MVSGKMVGFQTSMKLSQGSIILLVTVDIADIPVWTSWLVATGIGTSKHESFSICLEWRKLHVLIPIPTAWGEYGVYLSRWRPSQGWAYLDWEYFSLHLLKIRGTGATILAARLKYLALILREASGELYSRYDKGQVRICKIQKKIPEGLRAVLLWLHSSQTTSDIWVRTVFLKGAHWGRVLGCIPV